MSIESFAAVVSDNDGSAFITKAEFDSLKNNFQSQIDQYNTSIDSKIDGAIASYLAGIKLAGQEKRTLEMTQISNDGYIYSLLTKDMGMTAGYADLLVTLSYSFGSTNFGGAYLAWRSGGFVVNFTKSSDDVNQYSKRLFYRKNNGDIIYDGYWTVNEYYSGVLGINKINYDAGFNQDATGASFGLFCWCSHNTAGGTKALNSWWGNLWTKWGPVQDGDMDYRKYYVVDFSNIKSVTTRTKNIYQALFLYDYDDEHQYPCWNINELSNNVIEPQYNAQDSLNTRIISQTLETLWDASTKTQSWNQTGNDVSVYKVFEQPTQIKASSVSQGATGRSGYLNRKICVTNPEMKKVSTFLQNDLRTLEWTNSSEVKETLKGYSLSAGVPVTSVKDGEKVEWTPKIIKISDRTVADIDIEFYYGVYNGTNTNRVLDVNKSASTGKYTFEAKEGAMIFARWQNGYALDLDNSTELYVTTN